MSAIGEEDRQWASDAIVVAFHDEFCEYGGTDDGVDVCDGACREFAESLTGLSPSDEAIS
jgi:hypothetical protein